MTIGRKVFENRMDLRITKSADTVYGDAEPPQCVGHYRHIASELYAFNVQFKAKACSMFFKNVVAKFFDGFEHCGPGVFVLFFNDFHNRIEKSIETGSNFFSFKRVSTDGNGIEKPGLSFGRQVSK